MRQDVRLGMAVGGLLVGAVLAYAIFSGPKNKGTDQAGQVARDTNAAGANGGAAGSIPTPDPVTSNGANTGAGTNGGAAGGAGTISPPTGTQTPPSTNDIQVRGPERSNPPIGTNANDPIIRIPPSSPTGKWDWEMALSSGAGSALLRTEQPGPTGLRNEEPGGSLRREMAGPATRPNEIREFTRPEENTGPRTYVVKSGETFWTIARDNYGNGGYWSHVARANPRIDPKGLKAGTVINLPARSEVVPAESVRAAAPVARQIDPTREYRVKQGDSLTVICKALYGKTDPVTIGRLYEANRDLIGPNPSALKLGMVLTLPEPPTRVAAAN